MDIFCVCVSSPCRYADAATTYHRSLSLKIEEKFVRFLFSLLSIFVCFFLQRHFLSILWLCLCLNLNIVSYIRKSKWNRILDIQLFVFFLKEIKRKKAHVTRVKTTMTTTITTTTATQNRMTFEKGEEKNIVNMTKEKCSNLFSIHFGGTINYKVSWQRLFYNISIPFSHRISFKL